MTKKTIESTKPLQFLDTAKKAVVETLGAVTRFEAVKALPKALF